MRLTTHRVMAPRLRAALDSASNLIGHRIGMLCFFHVWRKLYWLFFTTERKKDLEYVMNLLQGGGKAHLMTLMEADFQDSESALRTYRDPRGEQSMNNARIFAAGRLRKAIKESTPPK